MERLQCLHLFTGADELDRLTADLADRQRSTTPGIPVELGEHCTGDADLVVEGAGEFRSLLTDHRINNQQHLVRLHSGADPHHLIHHLGVDLKATGGVDQQRVEPLVLRLGQTRRGNVLRPGLRSEAEHLNSDLPTEGPELFDGGWPVDIGTHHQGTTPLVLQMQTELCGGGGLTGTLQAGHQNNGWGFSGLGKRGVIASHHLHKLFMHHLDELLIRADPTNHFGADGFLPHIGNKVLHHGQADIGLEQGPAHIL